MKVLVVGKGGREHALAKALAESPSVEAVFAIPGNQGMEPQITLCPGSETFEGVQKAYQDHDIDLVVIGPETPLVNGLADELRKQGVAVFGPDQAGARLEGSKIFCKQFMEKYQVPTSAFEVVTNKQDTLKAAAQFTPPYVFKADGLAAGKGVFICQSREELAEAATQVFEENLLGEAGHRALIEQFQPGYELSFFILTNGEDFVSLPMAQDHKRLLDDDKGPNTGGMGTIAPMSISAQDYQQIIEQVAKPTVRGLKAEGFTYRGVVFIGLMMTEAGPQVLEYNIRFGDPETQVLLPLLDGDWGQCLMQIAQGEIPDLAWKQHFVSCVVLAAENYPQKPVTGVEIQGDLTAAQDQYFLHAGTKKQEGQWYVNGGRVLNAIGIGPTRQQSLDKAYKQAQKANWPGRQMRLDIGGKAPS